MPDDIRVGGVPAAWNTAIADWVAWLRLGGLAAATLRLRRDHLRMIARRSGTGHPRELTLAVIVEVCSGRDWSREHRKSVRASLISFGDWAVDHGWIGHNPAVLLPKVIAPTAAPRPAPDDVWRALLAAAPPRERLMARLAGEAGLRRAEIARARRDDLIADRHGWCLLVHGKGDRQRVVPVTDGLAAAIAAHSAGGWLFPAPDGGHLSVKYVGTLLSRLMPPGWTAHKLRHRFATRGYAATGNLRAVQEALGHASVATTQRYTAVSSQDIRLVVEAAGRDTCSSR